MEQFDSLVGGLGFVNQNDGTGNYLLKGDGVHTFTIGIMETNGIATVSAFKLRHDEERDILDYLVFLWEVDKIEDVKILFKHQMHLQGIVARSSQSP